MNTSDAKILNQEEIDSLLGNNKRTGHNKTGIDALLNSATTSHERLPMLDIVFDRLARLMATSLRNFTQDNVEISIDGIDTIRFGDYLDQLTLPSLLSVFKADEWHNFGLISMDSSLVYSTIDVLLGGRRGTAAMRIEGRPYTTIELNLIKNMVEIVLEDLSKSFDLVSSVRFSYDRLETNPRFATISRLSNAVIVAKFHIDMEDRGGKLDLIIPYSTLEPIRELLQQMFMGERHGKDIAWEQHLSQELFDTEVELKALLKEQTANLGDIAKWQEGTFLPLNISADEEISVVSGDIPLLKATMGRKGTAIIIKIKDKVKKNV